jgi:hypothetical protein
MSYLGHSKSKKMPQSRMCGTKLDQTLCESKISEAKLGVLVTWWQKNIFLMH